MKRLSQKEMAYRLKILSEYEEICKAQPLTDKAQAYQMTFQEFLRVFGLEAIKATDFSRVSGINHGVIQLTWQDFLHRTYIKTLKDAISNNQREIPLKIIKDSLISITRNKVEEKEVNDYLRARFGLTAGKLTRMKDDEVEQLELQQNRKQLC